MASQAIPVEMPEPRRARWADVLVALGLLLAVSAPPIAVLLGHDSSASAVREFRRPTARPALTLDAGELRAYPRRFEAWYRDAFGFRATLIESYNRALAVGLGQSPSSHFVLGDERWIFHREASALETFRGVLPFEDEDLVLWRRSIEQRTAHVASWGGQFLFVCVPSKLEIYPERVPARFTRLGPSRRDQLLDYMSKSTDLDLLDVKQVLHGAKVRDQPGRHVCFPYGVHWTDRGARVAYAAMLNKIAETVPGVDEPWRLEDFREEEVGGPVDSWAEKLYLEEYFTATESFFIPLRLRQSVRDESFKGSHWEDTLWRNEDTSLPTAVVYHDSNGGWLLPFLAEHFSVMYGVRHVYYDPKLMAEREPDVVLVAQTDRYLVSLLPFLQGAMNDPEFRAAFEASDDVRIGPESLAGLDFRAPFADGTVELVLDEGAARLDVTLRSGANALQLPLFDPDTGPASENRMLVLRLDLTCEKDGYLDVFLRREADAEFDSTRTFPLETRAGRHVEYIPIDRRDMAGELLLRLSHDPGQVSLHGIELRAVRRPPQFD